ncbi:MAG: hypothetical protein ACRCTL_06585, partial [Pseudomonas sp.]
MTRAQDLQSRYEQNDPLDRRLQARRLTQIANVQYFVLLLIGLQTVLAQSWLNTVLVLLALVLVLVGQQLNRRGATDTAIVLMLVSLAGLVTVSLWYSQGLYSGVLLAYPAILIVAGMVAPLWLFIGLLLGMLVSVAGMTYASLSGLL